MIVTVIHTPRDMRPYTYKMNRDFRLNFIGWLLAGVGAIVAIVGISSDWDARVLLNPAFDIVVVVGSIPSALFFAWLMSYRSSKRK
jgi:hypothetical protein